MNVLLIHPGSGGIEFAENFQVPINPYLPPLGILYLGSILEENDHKVNVIDLNAEKFSKDDCKKVLNNFDAVGMTTYCHSFEQDNSLKISKMIKDIDPSIPLILGGPHGSLLPKQSLIDYNADICVRGRGETVIYPIIEALNGNGKMASIPNIYYREGNKIAHTKFKAIKVNYDDLHYPARHLVDKYDYGYLNGKKLAKGRLTSIITSRGCVNRCNFCNIHAYIPNCTYRSVEKIKKEIEDIYNKGYETLTFVDDNFMIKKKTVNEIMDFIIKNDFNFRIWIFGARIDAAERSLFEKMRHAGTDIINFGIESGSQKVLNFYNKRLTISQIKYAINLSKEMGFLTTGTFMIGAPIETKEDINKTIKFSNQLPLDAAIFFAFHYTYKSKLWQDALNNGKIKSNDFRLIPDKSKGLGNFSPNELFKLTRKASFIFFLNPQRWIRMMKSVLINNDTRLIGQGYQIIRKVIIQ